MRCRSLCVICNTKSLSGTLPRRTQIAAKFLNVLKVQSLSISTHDEVATAEACGSTTATSTPLHMISFIESRSSLLVFQNIQTMPVCVLGDLKEKKIAQKVMPEIVCSRDRSLKLCTFTSPAKRLKIKITSGDKRRQSTYGKNQVWECI
jgi:hypothetical protein